MNWNAIIFFSVAYGYPLLMVLFTIISHRHHTRDPFGNSGMRL